MTVVASQRIRLQAYGLLALTTLFWGMNAVFARVAVGEISPMTIVVGRWLLVVLILAPIVWRDVRREWPALRERIGLLVAMGALGLAVFNGLFYIAAYHTTAVNMGILQGTMPAFILIGMAAVFRARIAGLQWVGAAVTLLGVTIVACAGDPVRLLTLSFNAGDMLVVLACLLYSGYSLGLRARPATSSLSLFAVLASAAFVASLPMLAIEVAIDGFQAPTPKGWLLIVVIAVFPSLLSQLLFIRGVAVIGADRAGIFVNLVPVFAAILGVVFLGETFAIHHGVGLAAVLAGIAFSESSRSNR